MNTRSAMPSMLDGKKGKGGGCDCGKPGCAKCRKGPKTVKKPKGKGY